MAESTRIAYNTARPIGKVVSMAAAYQLKANALWLEAIAMMNSATGGGVTPGNLEPDDLPVAGTGATFYTLVNSAKVNSAEACLEIGKIDQGMVV